MRVTDLEGERWASLRSVASEGRLDLRPLELDVREDASCRAAIDRILADEGRVDVVMNNAAMMMHGLTGAFRPEQVLQILDLNAVSWLRVNRAALPVMRRAGKGLLIYTGSGINRLPDPFGPTRQVTPVPAFSESSNSVETFTSNSVENDSRSPPH
jgi:NAD(P)-dependent dehydrogenase (short-subunit alcohol dehydrogenase family)